MYFSISTKVEKKGNQTNWWKSMFKNIVYNRFPACVIKAIYNSLRINYINTRECCSTSFF